MTILSSYMYNRFNKLNMLIVSNTLTFIGGIGMVLTIQDVGISNWFSFWFYFSSIIDIVNDFVSSVMILSYLKIESRGMVLVIIN